MATASPAKFPEAISEARLEATSSRIQDLLGKPKAKIGNMIKGQDWVKELKSVIEAL